MLLIVIASLVAQFLAVDAQSLDINGVSLADRVLWMERQLLTPGKLDFPVTPCKFLLNDNPSRGEQTSAEWVRIIFHDVITHNAATGTGGLDASIGFETDREENVGVSFVNATIVAFNLFFGVYNSMSDMIAQGLVEALQSCDPTARSLPLRVGRVDATGPGPAGVPGPADSLAFATAAFAKAGFSSTEMIQAIACGHSLGGVHHVNFPDIVPASQQSDTNLDGVSGFDSTMDVFDATGVNEYLTGTGAAGGPLVVGSNVTTRSDLRIFSSDGNATIRAMSSAQAFEDTCFTIFEKMINTVPSGVVLSAPIGPRPWILMESHLGLSSSGVVSYAGIITTHGSAVPPATASFVFQTSGGTTIGPFSSNSGVTVPFRAYTSVTDYTFNATLTSTTITSVTVQSSFTDPINLSVVILAPTSFWVPIRTVNGIITQQYVVRAAVLSSLASNNQIKAILYFPKAIPGTASLGIGQTVVTMSSVRSVGTYRIFQAFIVQPGPVSMGESFIDVKVGSVKVSAKMSTTMFSVCSNTASPLTC